MIQMGDEEVPENDTFLYPVIVPSITILDPAAGDEGSVQRGDPGNPYVLESEQPEALIKYHPDVSELQGDGHDGLA